MEKLWIVHYLYSLGISIYQEIYLTNVYNATLAPNRKKEEEILSYSSNETKLTLFSDINLYQIMFRLTNNNNKSYINRKYLTNIVIILTPNS